MPFVSANGARLFYVQQGSGGQTVIFSHGLLWSHRMFESQLAHLSPRHTVIAYDHRGQGQSEVAPGRYDMELLAADALALIDRLADGPVHFVGLSMGGFVGLRLAARYPEKIKSLVLLETSAQPEPRENLAKYRLLNALVRWLGVIGPVANQVMPIMFARSWLADPARQAERQRWLSELKSNRRAITKSVQAVIDRQGVEDELPSIRCPTLIIVGDEDVATTPDKARFMQQRIPGAVLHIIPGAGHSSSIERPEAINGLLDDWLAGR